MSYKHLTENERYQIYVLLKAGHDQEYIAKALGRSGSTISREIARNSGKRGYRPKQAQEFAEERKQISASNAACITAADWVEVENHLRKDWSPEQIAGTTGLASTESIYQHIYSDKVFGGTLWQHLRCKKKRRKRYGSGRQRRGQIPNKTPISERPAVVDKKTRLGDWEGDTIIGKGHKGVIVTLAERSTQFVLIRKVPNKEAEVVQKAIRSMMKNVASVSHTLTFDNGKEFAEHEKIAHALDLTVFFADPYASWQRGLNEQINGLIRQYLPKGTSFENVTDAEIEVIQKKLNSRPRKSLGFKTPAEVFLEKAKRKGVALRF